MRKQDAVPPVFGDGPEVQNEEELAAWLAQQQRAVMLPFTVWRTPPRVGAVGVHDAPPPKTCRLDDMALGVPLAERLRHLFDDASPCHLWLAGRFASDDTFLVRAVHEPVTPSPALRARSVRGPECLAIRALTPMHCARGSARCERCAEAALRPSSLALLDLCPYGDRARPTTKTTRDGRAVWCAYDVLRTFASEAEATEFARRHGITDVT
ncbi:MAG: hypothetical protein KIT84_11720 [Labilithrix sp.]|nr:hypothetical protein [Labilithrix sp.]MCW5811678.1 hypothetical protein [Labilithrix sp.]